MLNMILWEALTHYSKTMDICSDWKTQWTRHPSLVVTNKLNWHVYLNPKKMSDWKISDEGIIMGSVILAYVVHLSFKKLSIKRKKKKKSE